ncbi:hypothetical protein [Pseudozobellia thermophila]|uniref:Uncharacterized protein n=1 Tax=Pseudozobellia thermophila TaxID=192903 RepID=A0A1M6JVJ1_9FLAO|nr:hypothetical protein [Pseudozobellia thermophila]SHJ50686.1 hypothetical protein SAMN04488513_105167 [Pseudozobellia thermophila]
MKKPLYTLIILSLFALACKETKKPETTAPEDELPILEQLAYANGYGNWNKVQELKFTFNVDRDTTHFERSWIWKPKSNEVTALTAQDTITYNRSRITDSLAYKADGNFINDKYWLLAPINILWDKNSISTKHSVDVEAPLSKKNMQKLTVVYNAEGGYTPGDAYDFYFEDDLKVQEWVFRRANQEEPSMITTWEDYTEMGGLQLAQMHKNKDGSFKLYFTGLEASTKD